MYIYIYIHIYIYVYICIKYIFKVQSKFLALLKCCFPLLDDEFVLRFRVSLFLFFWTCRVACRILVPLFCAMISCFSCVQLCVIIWTVARQAPLSMGFSRQEYWNGLSCPPPGDLPDLGIELASPASSALQAESLPLSHQGSPLVLLLGIEPTSLAVEAWSLNHWTA